MTSPDESHYQLALKIKDWLYIDGTMDNDIRRCRDRSDDDEPPSGSYWNALARLGQSIREAGWKQLPDWPNTYKELQRWGNAGETGAISLTAEQWTLVVAALQHGATIDDAVDEPEQAARSRAQAAAIRTGTCPAGRERSAASGVQKLIHRRARSRTSGPSRDLNPGLGYDDSVTARALHGNRSTGRAGE
jgi:hypothetical protein